MSVLAAASPFPRPTLHFLNIVMLQVHTVLAGLWALCAIATALVAVPQLRRIPSAFGLHVLQQKWETVSNVMFGAYLLTFGTGTWLLYKQAIYRPPFSSSAWDKLRHEPYGVPYYYALYGKILVFFLMGAATYVLAREARRAAAESEAAGGPVDMDLDTDDSEWMDEEVLPQGRTDDLGVAAATEGSTLTETRAMARRHLDRAATSPLVLWGSVAVLVVGLGAVGCCVTLIKYFHELSKSAVVYQILSQ